MFLKVVLAVIIVATVAEGRRRKVYFSAWNSAILKNIAGGTTIVYDEVVTNEGDAYNKETGKFISPRKGPYVFTWTAITTDRSRINVFIHQNGKRLTVAQADSLTGTQNGSGSNTIVLNLEKGDVVELKCGEWGDNNQHLLYGEAHSTFSGWAL